MPAPAPENRASAESAAAGPVAGGGPKAGSPSTNDADKSSPHEKKIKRIQLSCTSCRHRKLKCNRIQPCENCVKRGQANSCHFANPGPKKTPAQARLSARNNELQQRLLHLEELVVSLQNRNDGSPEDIAATIQARSNTNPAQISAMDGAEDYPGRMVTDKKGTRYVDAAHWQAMLDEITQVKEYIGNDREDSRNTETDDPGTPLLLGSIAAATKADLLGGIPSRSVVDKLVTRWFHAKEPGLICIHVPSFLIEYDRFWKEPKSFSPGFLSLLYSIIWLGTAFYVRTGTEVPTDRPADVTSLMDFYLAKAAQGLILSDYTRPGKYKLEALCLYFGAEYQRFRDAHVGLSFLISIIVRVAMLSGYHRDPKHFPSLTPFEGEMRRRTWALVLQLDTLIAFQVGLPRTINEWQCDTKSPSNLHSEDLAVDMERLPPSRPETERTTVTYQIAKGRLMSVFGTISDRAYSRERMTYDEIMLLDMRLREAFDSIPSFLKVKPLDLTITDPPEVIMQRFNLQFTYHKGRCILHRRCFSGALNDARCLYSKRICVESATEILKRQKEIHDATMENGVLKHESWYLSSLTTHDFILAAMILCLWLSREQHNVAAGTAAQLDALEALRAQPNSSDMFETLEDSYKIWLSLKDVSYEAFKASRALAVMLGKTRARADKSVEPLSDNLTTDFSARMAMNDKPADKPVVQRNRSSVAASASSNSTAYTASQNSGSPQDGTPPSDMVADENGEYDLTDFDPSVFGVVSENLLDAPLDLDWGSWDMQFRVGGASNVMDPINMDWSQEQQTLPDLNLQNINMSMWPSGPSVR